MKRFYSIFALAALSGLVAVADADTIYTGITPLTDVQILGTQNGSLRFINRAGAEVSRSFDGIKRLEVSNEPAFNSAEEAFEAGNFDKATEGYIKTIRSTNKPWLKEWSGLRLQEAAEKSGDFPAAVTAWVELIQSNPAAAAGRQPKLPEGTSTFLNTAAADIERVLQGRLDDKQKAELLKLLLDIYQRKGDNAKALSTAERLAAVAGDSGDPANQRLLADLKISLAKIALDKKDYAKVKQEIASASASIAQPQQQATALYLLAEADRNLAGDDQQKLQDAAVAYMRVVAHFPKSDVAGDALMHAAEIVEKLGDSKKALALYQQIATEYPATNAKEQVERLKGDVK